MLLMRGINRVVHRCTGKSSQQGVSKGSAGLLTSVSAMHLNVCTPPEYGTSAPKSAVVLISSTRMVYCLQQHCGSSVCCRA